MNFTTDLFTHNLSLFEKYFSPYKGQDANYLEIGVKEGRSACWMLDNILTSNNSTISLIDVWWSNSDFLTFASNISLYDFRRIYIYKDFSQNVLQRLNRWFDMIYIDGSHSTLDVMSDLLQCWRILKPGGIIIMDDYLWPKEGKVSTPKEAIDLFIQYSTNLTILHKHYSVVFQKNVIN